MDFEEASTFAGNRPGFVFKKDAQGLGYYRDAPPEQPSVFREMNRARNGWKSEPKEAASATTEGGGSENCHYVVLGVARDVSDIDLRAAYRSMALKHHPDKNPNQSADATGTFQRIRAAYSLLSDPHERRWYDLHRDEILSGCAPLSGGAAAATGAQPVEAEEPAMDLWPYFSSSFLSVHIGEEGSECEEGSGGEEGRFFSIYRAVFDELAAEELLLQQRRGGEVLHFPRLGGASSNWEEVESFYAAWSAFSTARSGASAEKHDIARAVNKQRRKVQERENLTSRAEARQTRTELVRHLVAFVMKRDPRVMKHEAENVAKMAAAPSRKHTERMRLLQAELQLLEEEGEEEAEEEEEEVEKEEEQTDIGSDDDEEAALLQVAASRRVAGKVVSSGDDDDGDDSDEDDEDDEDAFLRLATGRAAATPKVLLESSEGSGSDDEDAFLQLAVGLGATKAKGAVSEVHEAHEEESPHKVTPPSREIVARSASSSIVTRKGKVADPEAAAAAAAGVRARRLEDGLGCRCCDFVGHNRKELLKHVQKKGHFSVRRELPDGLVYNEPQAMRDPALEKVERKQHAASVARGRSAKNARGE